MPNKANIGGVPVHAINLDEAVQVLANWIVHRERRYVYLCNVRSVVCCMRNGALRRAFFEASLVTPDGMPIVRILKGRGLPNVGRVYGPDLMLALCEHLQSCGCRHFFYGGAPGIPERLAARLKARYPGMQIAGMWSPPFRQLTQMEDQEIIARLNNSGADVVWVGLGAPKQECWIAEHRALLSAPVLIAVGYAFDALSGAKPQAPRWLRQAGFEWAFRLACEPERIWPRIFFDGPLFLAALGGQWVGLKRFAAPIPGRSEAKDAVPVLAG